MNMFRLLWFGVSGWRSSQLLHVSWDEVWKGSDARAPFELPLRIAILGRRWRTSVRHVVKRYPNGAFALRLAETVDDLESDPPPHILVVDSGEIPAVRSEYLSAAASSDGLPALIISPGVWWQLLGAAKRMPRGCALLLTPRRDFRKFFSALIEHIATDCPLDLAAGKAARNTLRRMPGSEVQKVYRRRSRSLLLLDRYVNQALRMSDALEMLSQEFELSAASMHDPHPNLRELAEEKLNLTSGRPSFVSGAVTVDVVLLRACYREGNKRTLDPGTTLQGGRRYIVQVHLGAQLRASILKQGLERPEAGPLYPTLNPQLFEVVLQHKDFTLRSPMRRFLYLEAGGVSCRVRFGVRAPGAGIAEMRLIVFSGNQMLQAIEVKAKIADREYASDVPAAGATAEVSFAQMEDLVSDPELPPRLATISVNRSTDTHTMLMKSSESVAGFDLSDSLVQETLKDYRKILKDATSADGGKSPRFPGLESERPSDESRTYIRRLAELGEKMHNKLYHEDRAALLNGIRSAEDGVLSIVRHDFGFAWPWTVLYDFELPIHLFGTTPRVCFGFTENGQPCGHDGSQKVCCVRGFWGYRLQIEELDGASVSKRRVNTIAGHTVPVMYINASGTQASQAFVPALAAIDGIPGEPATLVEDLWSSETRPAIAVLLGHLQIEDVPGQPTGPRMVVGGTPNAPTAWLRDSEVMSLVKRKGSWPDPNSIVMLLSCESAATSPATLSSLVLSFLKARASAVVGTECPAFSGLLARFGKDVAEGMVQDEQPLGEVLRSTRRRLLHQGNPLAFVLNAIGVADLKVRRAQR